MANLQKIIKVTQQQYDTLASGGTVGSYTGLNDNFIYLVQNDNPDLPTIGSADNNKFLHTNSSTGELEWTSIETKYRHNIQIQYSTAYIATFSIITSDSSAYTTVAQIRTALNTNGFSSATAVCPAQGQYYASTSAQTNLVIGIYSNGSTLGFKYIILATTTDNTMTINQVVSTASATNSNTPTIYDIVEAL